MTINKAIIGASYDNSGTLNQVLRKIEKQALKEKNKSSRSQHNLYRSIDDENTSKFNYSICGIPIIAYGMMNFFHTDIERIAVVGNQTTHKIFDSFVDYFNVNRERERFVFIPEGNRWSLENTLRKGKKGIEVSDNEMVIFCSGDLPLGTEIEQFRFDPDNINYDMIVNLNSMRNIYGKDFKDKVRVNGSVVGPYRRWHLPLKKSSIIEENNGKIKNAHWIKENNLYTFKLDNHFLDIINTAYSGRKQYDDNPGEKNKKGGRWNTIKELGLNNGKWYKILKEAPAIFPYLMVRGLSSYNPALVSFDDFSNFASVALERRVKIKATHSDFGFLNDIDSAEDIIFNEIMMRSVDPNSLYPHWDQLKNFGDHLRKQEIPIVNQFPRYINSWFSNFSNLCGNELFNGNGEFQETDLSRSMQDKVELVVKNRQRYLLDLSHNRMNQVDKSYDSSCQHLPVTN